MTIRFQPTPNPNAGKFVLDRRVIEGDRPKSFYTMEEAQGNRLAEALLALDGVANVFMVEDFITVTKRPDADWGALIPHVERAIRENF